MPTAVEEKLTEQTSDWLQEVTVNREERVIKNVALTAGQSKNGYTYTEKALRNAVPLYENIPVFIDHAKNLRKPFERSTRDLAGSIRNPRFEGNRIRGDVTALDSESGRLLLSLAEANMNDTGMSQVVLAERSEDDRTLIESIKRVVSVDAVVFPATTHSFSEQTGADPMAEATHQLIETQQGKIDELTEQSREHKRQADDYKSKLEKLQSEYDSLSEQHQKLEEEKKDLSTKLDEYQTKEQLAERRQAVLKALKEADLDVEDKAVVSELWLENLQNEADEDKRKKMIEDRKALVETVPEGKPISTERREETTDKKFDVEKALKDPAVFV